MSTEQHTIAECLDQGLLPFGSRLEITLFSGALVRRGIAPHHIPRFIKTGQSERGDMQVIGYIIGKNKEMMTLSPTIYPHCPPEQEQEFSAGIYYIEHEAIHSWRLLTT